MLRVHSSTYSLLVFVVDLRIWYAVIDLLRASFQVSVGVRVKSALCVMMSRNGSAISRAMRKVVRDAVARDGSA